METVPKGYSATEMQTLFLKTYLHNGSKIVATVGERRLEYKRKRGPRGGHIKDAPLNPHPDATGTQVSGIVHAGHVLYVWSYGPPFGGWANPSMVGPSSVTNIEYFDGH